MIGTVKSINFEKGWGFINSDGVNTDIYFKSTNKNIYIGMPVQFTITFIQDGNMQAKDVTVAAQSAPLKGSWRAITA